MKKTLLLLSIATILSTSCQGPAGEPGESITFHVENFTIRPGDWTRVSTGPHVTLYECILQADVRTEAYEQGIVNAYIFLWDEASRSEVQTQLPYWTQHTDSGYSTWMEGYNFDFDERNVAFYAECRNGTTPPECNFRLVVAP
jgi:hypothetical protein